jgi:hypothetical protein
VKKCAFAGEKVCILLDCLQQGSATIFSLIETAKENNLDPFHYLVWVLSEAPTAAAGDADWPEKLTPAHAPESCRNLQAKSTIV